MLSNALPSGILPPARAPYINLPKWCHKVGTKHLDIDTYMGHFTFKPPQTLTFRLLWHQREDKTMQGQEEHGVLWSAFFHLLHHTQNGGRPENSLTVYLRLREKQWLTCLYLIFMTLGPFTYCPGSYTLHVPTQLRTAIYMKNHHFILERCLAMMVEFIFHCAVTSALISHN